MKSIVKYFAVSIFLFVSVAACVQQQTPQTAQSYYDNGMALYRQGDYGSAISEFNLAIDLRPRFVEAHYYLGKCYERKDMLEAALDAYAACIDMDPHYLPAHESMGILLAQVELYDEAKRHLEFAGDLNSYMPEVYYYLGEIYRMEGHCRRATEAYRHTLALAPDSVSAEEGLVAVRNECDRDGGRSRGVIKHKSFIGGGKALNEREF